MVPNAGRDLFIRYVAALKAGNTEAANIFANNSDNWQFIKYCTIFHAVVDGFRDGIRDIEKIRRDISV